MGKMKSEMGKKEGTKKNEKVRNEGKGRKREGIQKEVKDGHNCSKYYYS